MELAGLDRLSEADITRILFDAIQPAEDDMLRAGLVAASVLLPLFRLNDGWHLIYTRRTERVMNHKGQVSFPGGSADPEDADAVQTALRETFEEIGVPADCVRVLGQMSRMATVTGFLITPVVGVVCWPYDLRPAEIEVERVFSVPLAWLADSSNRKERLYTRSDGSSEMVIFYEPYDGEIIWGATARITQNFIQRLINK